jgi:uncharacterized membrane protein (UPF0127 family)
LERQLIHKKSGGCLAARVRLANTASARLRGLMFRRRLEAGEGIWLRPCQSVHTFWMFFPIDVLFLDRNLTVLSIIENLRPFRVTWPRWRAWSVVELAAGTVAQTGLCVGDELALVRGEEP